MTTECDFKINHTYTYNCKQAVCRVRIWGGNTIKLMVTSNQETYVEKITITDRE